MVLTFIRIMLTTILMMTLPDRVRNYAFSWSLLTRNFGRGRLFKHHQMGPKRQPSHGGPQVPWRRFTTLVIEHLSSTS
ncbi:hypothetical protein AMTRI_Chr06g194410 [Amborella trichopoda]